MENIKELAEAIYNDLAPWEKEDNIKREILETLEINPLEMVKYLIDRFITEA